MGIKSNHLLFKNKNRKIIKTIGKLTLQTTKRFRLHYGIEQWCHIMPMIKNHHVQYWLFEKSENRLFLYVTKNWE
jgi:hypothetical protein